LSCVLPVNSLHDRLGDCIESIGTLIEMIVDWLDTPKEFQN